MGFKLNRTIVALAVGAFLVELAYAILNMSAFPVYMREGLHNESRWGILLGTFLIAEAVARPAFGALGDRIGRKPLLVLGPAVTVFTAYIITRLGGGFAIPVLFILRVVDGMGGGAFWPSVFATIGDVVEECNRATAMSIINVSYMGGMALAFLAGGMVNEYYHSYLASFYLVAILLACAVAGMLLLLPRRLVTPHPIEPVHGEPLEMPSLEEPAKFTLRGFAGAFKIVPEMLALASITFLGIGLLMPVVKWYAMDQLALNEKEFGIAVAPIAAAMGIFAVPLGRLVDKMGKCWAVCWGLLACAVSLWIISLSSTLFAALAGGTLLGVGFTVAFPAWMALVSSVTDSSNRGQLLGAVGMAQGLAAIIGASLGAPIYSNPKFGIPAIGISSQQLPFILGAFLVTIGVAMAFTWVRSRYCILDPGGGITILQRNAILVAVFIWLAAVAMIFVARAVG